MSGLRIASALVLLLSATSASAIELFSGIPRSLTIPAQDERVLLNLYTFASPAGALRAAVETTAEVESHDIDLFVRFGRPPAFGAAPSAEIATDFSSAAVGQAQETVLIDAGSTPPLQTGLYYVAVLVKTLHTEIHLTVRATSDVGGPARAFIASTFDIDEEFWTTSFPPSSLPGAVPGSIGAGIARMPEGFLRFFDAQTEEAQDFLRAPPKFLGNLADFDNAEIRFDFRRSSGELAAFPIELRILGALSAWTLTGPRSQEEWITVRAPLEAELWTRVVGEASFEQTLRNVSQIAVSVDHQTGFETNDIDNFIFEGSPSTPAEPGQGPTFSDFEQGTDGWSRNFPASALPGASAGAETASIRQGLGGRQSDGFLMAIGGDGIGLDHLVAPPRFTAGLAELDRPWYEFYLRRVEGSFPPRLSELRLLGNGSVYQWRGARVRETWERFRAAIDERNWLHVSGPEDFEAMLRNAQRLELLVDMSDGPEVIGLDDFHLRTQFTPPEGPALQLAPAAIDIPAAEGSATPIERTLDILSTGAAVEWGATIDPELTSWLELSATGGATPAEVVLRIDPTGLPAGLYEADVVVASAQSGVASRRARVTLIVGADPRIPLIDGVTNAADPLAPLSAGALGSLFGRFLAGEERVVAIDPQTGLLPTEAGGVELRVLGPQGELVALAPLLYIGPGQINFQLPLEVAGRSSIEFAIVRSATVSERFATPIAQAGPAIFAIAGGLAAVTHLDGTLVSADTPARAGSILTAYFTGIGPVSPPTLSGQPTPADQLRTALLPAAALVGQTPAEVIGTALAPGFVGLGQLSLRVPGGATGRVILTIQIGDQRSNGVFVWVE